MNLFNKILISFLSLSLMTNVLAESETASIGGAAKVNSSCTVSATDLSFGNVVTSKTGQNTNTSLIVATCTKDTAFSITFDHGNGTTANRAMIGVSSSDNLFYNIYKDNAYSQILGDGNDGSVIITDIATGQDQSYNVYGTLSSNQYVTPDNYIDNIVVNLTY